MRGRKALAAALLLGGCASIQAASPPGMRAYEVSVAVAPQRAAIAWHGHVTGLERIYLRWLSPSGRPRGVALPVTDGARHAYEPDLQFAAGAPVLAWYEKGADGALTAWLARLDDAGRVVWRAALSGAGGYARNPVVRAAPEGLHVGWLEAPGPGDQPAVWTQAFDLAGRPAGPPRRLAEASVTTWNLNATLAPDGRFLLTWDAFAGRSANELRLAAAAARPTRTLTLTPDDGQPSTYPDIAVSPGGQAAVAWFDRKDGNEEVYLAVLPLADLLAGAPLPARRITHTAAASIGAYLAWNGERLALAWCDAEPGQNEVYLQRFAADGAPAGPSRRLTRTAAESLIPSIRPARRGFLLGWNEYGPGPRAGHDEAAPSAARVLRTR